MCNCDNKERAEAWDAVSNALLKGNPFVFHASGRTGTLMAVSEIERLYTIERRADATREQFEQDFKTLGAERDAWSAAHTRVVNERNAQNDRANGAEHLLREERKQHAETVKLLEGERAKVREFQHQITTPKTGFNSHRQHVAQASAKYGRSYHGPGSPNHPERIAQAVLFLLNHVEKLETALKDVPVPAYPTWPAGANKAASVQAAGQVECLKSADWGKAAEEVNNSTTAPWTDCP